ncbi:hypothetical protein NDN11_09355 [Acinetobacter sp. C26M]|uniref:virulence factor TspB C-terminal domain-related protein n=1 Tax=unclassified Acinetobacter TaxID=196816 RepID=UPI00203717D8|nr:MULTISPECIES: virulence factor TspB C-terminal domain-related protein [unclassified Acinetobacter]USA44942.1 hypothetical protein NDN11_09355 [Acinetobacter sp. C26M]USA48445.1 hypothetical protein NDN12_09355 [Acinetobacter sp. C26G]
MKCLLAFLLCIFSFNAFAGEYYPESRAKSYRDADIVGSSGTTTCNGNQTCFIPVYGCKGEGEWLETYYKENGSINAAYCNSCPTGFGKGSVYDSEGNFLYFNCQKPCDSGFKLLRGMCQSCPEIYKEWRVDNPEIGEQCLAKKCPSNKMLDTKTGTCIDYDPKCEQQGMETILPPSGATFKAFCSNYCKKDPSQFLPGTPMEYRSSNFADPNFYQCRPYPSCPQGTQIRINQTKLGSTYYEDVKCESLCNSDEFLIDGTCYQRCPKDHFFIDGQCTDKDPIVESVNNFNWNVSDAFSLLGDFLEDSFIQILDLFSVFNDGLDDLDDAVENNVINPTGEELPDSVDTSEMNAETPFKQLPAFTKDFFNFYDQNYYPNNPQCPADRTVVLLKTEYTFKYSKLCTPLETLSKLLMALVLYLCARILWSDD